MNDLFHQQGLSQLNDLLTYRRTGQLPNQVFDPSLFLPPALGNTNFAQQFLAQQAQQQALQAQRNAMMVAPDMGSAGPGVGVGDNGDGSGGAGGGGGGK